MSKLNEKMETRRFLREVAEARRRYAGSTDGSTAVVKSPPKPSRQEDGPVPQAPPPQPDTAPKPQEDLS